MDNTIPDSAPQKQCNRCKQALPHSEFTIDRNKKDGFRTICKACTKAPKTSLPPIPDGYKRCRTCETIKPATDEFFNKVPSYVSKDCLNRQCKECRNAYRKSSKQDKPNTPNPQGSTKKCQKCEQDFPATLEYFFLDRSTKDRLRAWCKSCSNSDGKAYRLRPGGIEARRAYRRRYAERDRKYHQAYRQTHKEHNRAYKRRYNAANIEHIRVVMSIYRKAERTKALMSAKYHRRRARKLGNGGAFTAQDIQAQYKRQRGKCYYCYTKFGKGKNAYHIEHII